MREETVVLLAVLRVASVPEAIVRVRAILVELERLQKLEAFFKEWFPANYDFATEEVRGDNLSQS